MRFDLRKPCKDCPFRTDRDFALLAERRLEIGASLERGEWFPCHETTAEDDETLERRANSDSQHCAGVMIMLMKCGQPTQAMQLAERLGRMLGRVLFDPLRLQMDAPVFDSILQFVNCGRRRGQRVSRRLLRDTAFRLPRE